MKGLKFIAFTLLVFALAAMTRGVLFNALELKTDDSYFTVQLAEASRLEKESLRFRVDAAALVRGDPGTTADGVKMDFDIFWARANTELSRPLDPRIVNITKYRPQLKALTDGLTAIDPVVQSLKAGDAEGLAEIERVMKASDRALAEMNQKAYEELYQTSADTAVQQRATLHHLDLMQRATLGFGLLSFILLLFELRHGEKLNAELKGRESEIRAIAARDPLTGLANRRHFDDHMRSIDEGASADAAHLLMIDLDGFKLVNDRHGHDAGDFVLAETARRLADAVPDNHVIARLGGDEFAVLLAGDTGRATTAAEAILRQVSRPYHYEGINLNIGASIGIAMRQPGIDVSKNLRREADLALYEAKSKGRNMACAWQDSCSLRTMPRCDLKSNIVSAAPHPVNERTGRAPGSARVG